ncbi:viral A-type inclusion protein [Reticulomyxa filosa]|uniref:Viral A-type inclusion protein n=1 Tax=Reticulomyxa filosa TaxID=46433 RepID=X6PFC5_RETFI|nr:viral A-type inclusion protein [Reticulomyxa filosa]|eukprot:ETO36362.1 viral A-type inclusion protein [Reticulomyxa filosa]
MQKKKSELFYFDACEFDRRRGHSTKRIKHQKASTPVENKPVESLPDPNVISPAKSLDSNTKCLLSQSKVRVYVREKKKGLQKQINRKGGGGKKLIATEQTEKRTENEGRAPLLPQERTPIREEQEQGVTEDVKRIEGMEDLLWEKEQLHEINLRVENIFSVFGSKLNHTGDKGEHVKPDVTNDLREQGNKALKELAQTFLAKEEIKNQELANAKADIRLLQEFVFFVLFFFLLKKNLKLAKNDNLKKDNSKLRNEREQALREKDKALADNQNIKDAYELQLKALEGQNQKLTDENKHLQSNTNEVNTKKEQELAAKLAEVLFCLSCFTALFNAFLFLEKKKKKNKKLQERDDQYNKLKNETDEVFRQQMKDIQNSYEKQLEDLNSTVEAQKKELAELQGDLLKTSQDRDRIKKELDYQIPLREALENELKKQKEQAKEEIKRVKDSADDAQKNYRQLRDDHFTLQKTNLDLRAEIEVCFKKQKNANTIFMLFCSLKQKLDTFEEQHKIKSPVRPSKRRRTDSTLLESKILKSVQGPIITSRTVFPLECVTQQFEGDWVGFELQNQWNDSIILKGWSFFINDHLPKLPLPEKLLTSG